MLYGPDNRPLRATTTARRALTRRVATPSRTGFRSAQQSRSVATSLTPVQLRYLYQSVATGVWTPDFFELAEEIEERDLHYRGVLQQRCLRAAGAPLDVRPASDEAPDIELAEEVRTRILEGDGFHDCVLELLDALGKGGQQYI